MYDCECSGNLQKEAQAANSRIWGDMETKGQRKACL